MKLTGFIFSRQSQVWDHKRVCQDGVKPIFEVLDQLLSFFDFNQPWLSNVKFKSIKDIWVDPFKQHPFLILAQETFLPFRNFSII